MITISTILPMRAMAAEQALEQMVAVVNDDVITESELQHAVATAKVQMASQSMPTPPVKTLKKQVLNNLIDKKVQLQVAKQAGITVSDDELLQAITQVAKQNRMDVSELYQRINKEGITTDAYKEDMRQQIMLHKLQQQQVAGTIQITPQEVTAFMESKAWQNNSSKEYRLEDILIPFSEEPTSTEIAKARKRANSIYVDVKRNHKSFKKMAQVASKNKKALEGGDLGWRKLPEIPTAFTKAVSSLKKNDIAGPIQTPNGFHIIRLADVRFIADDSAPNRETVERLLLQRKFEEAVQSWASKLRSQAFVEIQSA